MTSQQQTAAADVASTSQTPVARTRSPVKRPSAQRPASPTEADFADVGRVGATQARGEQKHAQLAAREPKPTVRAAGSLFSAYKPTGVLVSYADNKVGIMPDLEGTLTEIANAAGIDISDPETMSQFIEAMVTDVYVNPYSDKQAFDGEIVVGNFTMPRRVVADVIQRKVGTMHRRFARAMAPLVVQVMHDNYETFGEVLDKRCTELALSTRAEAVRQFDGADALTVVDRDAAKRAAEAKHLALSVRPTSRAYTIDSSVASSGLHEQ